MLRLMLDLQRSVAMCTACVCLVVISLGPDIAAACEGGGGEGKEASIITVAPKPVKFAGGKTTQKITVRNWSAEALSLEVTATSGFKLLGGCSHVITSKCEETVECEKTLNSGWFKASTEPPDELYWDETKLEC
jgi:hypothetical protein